MPPEACKVGYHTSNLTWKQNISQKQNDIEYVNKVHPLVDANVTGILPIKSYTSIND